MGNILLHIPHSSTAIPEEWRRLFVVGEEELQREIVSMTDWHTDDLFALDGADRLVFPVSRLLVDPERFDRDEDEPMATKGMGAVYSLTHDGRPLKATDARQELMGRYYRPHHDSLEAWTDAALDKHGTALILDCHSFPSEPLRCDMDQSPSRPDFCIGTDSFHTPAELAADLAAQLRSLGFSVEIDRPYSGCMVPISRYRKDPRVQSVMVEVKRGLYVDESTGQRGEGYDAMKSVLARLLSGLTNQSRR